MKKMKIQDKKTYQPERFALTDKKAHSSINRSHIIRNRLGNTHGMKYARFKKKNSKVLIHKVTYSGVTIQIKEYIPTNDLSPVTVKTKEDMKLKKIFKTLCSQILKYNMDVIYNFTIIDIMSASYRKCQSSFSFFEEKNSVEPLQLKSHIQNFREDKMNIWNTKKNVLSKNGQFLYNQPPQFATLKYPLPKLSNVFPSVISYLYGNHREIMDIEKKMTECLTIKTESENYELKKLHSRSHTFLKHKSYNYGEVDWGCLEFDFNVFNDRECTKKGCSDVKFIHSKSDGNILDKELDSEQYLNMKESSSLTTYDNKIENDNELLGSNSSKEILLFSKNSDNIVEKCYKHVFFNLHTNEYSNVIFNEDKIPTEVSDFVFNFDREKKNPEKKFNENDEKNIKNSNEPLDNKSEMEILYSNKSDNIAEKCNKHVYSKLQSNEYSNIIVNEYEIPREVSEFVFWDLDGGKKNSEINLGKTEYSSDTECINDISGHSNSVQLLGIFDKHSELATHSTDVLDSNESLQNQNGGPIYEISNSFDKERKKSNNRNTTRNIEYEYAVPTNSHYHCFSMETNNHVPCGVYDPITESWREENLTEDSFDGNCKQGKSKFKRNALFYLFLTSNNLTQRSSRAVRFWTQRRADQKTPSTSGSPMRRYRHSGERIKHENLCWSVTKARNTFLSGVPHE